MQKIRVIRTKEDYEEALELLNRLLELSPKKGSEEGEKLALLALLIQDHESREFSIPTPDPVDAILYRMDQLDLTPADLVPYIGSRSKVSEVLSRKRSLSLSMIKALEAGLNIPVKTLLNESIHTSDNEIYWNKFPVKELAKRGYLKTEMLSESLVSSLKEFIKSIGSPSHVTGLLRKTDYATKRSINNYHLIAWTAAVVNKANKINSPKFNRGKLTLGFLNDLAKLSSKENGPILAIEKLRKIGIRVVVEPHFSKTYLDGALITVEKDRPIIGLTLRHDRLDNFWFNLLHELSHLTLHSDQTSNFFYENLDANPEREKKEKQADDMACEALIPKDEWDNSPAKIVPMLLAAQSLANKLGINPAIVAGKIRREGKRYEYLTEIIKSSKVRYLFTEETW